MGRQEDLIEADKRGLLTGQIKTDFDTAVSRGLIQGGPIVPSESESTLGGIEREPVSTGFLQRTGDIVSKRVGAVQEFVERGRLQPTLEKRKESLFAIPGVAIGQAALGAGELIGETVSTVAGKLIPEPIKEFTKQAVSGAFEVLKKDPIFSLGIKAFEKGGKLYADFKKKDPDKALKIESAAGTIGFGVGFGVSKKPAQLIAKEAVDVVSDTARLATVGTLTKSAKAIARETDIKLFSLVNKELPKIATPTVRGIATTEALRKFHKKSVTAIKTIIENAKGKLPIDLPEFSAAIGNTKKLLLSTVDDSLKKAGQAGLTVPTKNIVNNLEKARKSAFVTDLRPATSQLLDATIERIEKRGFYTPSDAQDLITNINAATRKIYNGTSTVDAGQIFVDEIVGRTLRKDLAKIVDSLGGDFKDVKKQLGSIIELEGSIVKAELKAARGKTKSLIDFSDILTTAEAVAGLAFKDPRAILRGVTGRGTKEYLKYVNSTERRIQRLFSEAQKIIEKGKVVPGPKSKTGKLVSQIF